MIFARITVDAFHAATGNPEPNRRTASDGWMR
jgi:hypothetical protein